VPTIFLTAVESRTMRQQVLSPAQHPRTIQVKRRSMMKQSAVYSTHRSLLLTDEAREREQRHHLGLISSFPSLYLRDNFSSQCRTRVDKSLHYKCGRAYVQSFGICPEYGKEAKHLSTGRYATIVAFHLCQTFAYVEN